MYCWELRDGSNACSKFERYGKNPPEELTCEYFDSSNFSEEANKWTQHVVDISNEIEGEPQQYLRLKFFAICQARPKKFKECLDSIDIRSVVKVYKKNRE